MRNKGKYRIPKAKALLPILGYTFIFVTVIVMIFAVLNMLADYVKDVRSEADQEYVEQIAARYDESTDEERAAVLRELADNGHDYCIVDSDGEIVDSYGKVTVKGFDKISGYITEEELKEMLEDSGLSEEDTQHIQTTFLSAGSDYTFLVEDENTVRDALGNAYDLARNDPGFASNYKKAVLTFPYWIGAPLPGSSQIILVKTELSVKVKDYIYLAGGLIISSFIAFIIFVIMIIGVIRNLHANRKMRSLLFRDNIAKGRNWLWYAITSQDILYKKRNANKTYAVVELVFVKYRNFVLCHSVTEAEDLLKQVVNITSRKLRRGELCAHSMSSGIPLLLEVADEDDARARIQDIISSLEAIPCGHRLAFRAGVCLVCPAQEKLAHNQKRYIPDIDFLYNNACSAGLSIADTDESGIAFFDDKLVEEERWINLVTERQQKAVDKEEFVIYYQPKYDPRTNELMGAEALIRWQTPDMGMVPPYKFIPIFEDNGFIPNIDHYMVSHVARDQRKWLSEGRNCVPISVNISRAHFSESDLAEQICIMVDQEGCPRNLLEIELTESAFFDDENAMINTINRLKYYGFLVSMDDFGSGYSSLNSLKDMPLDILKLDAGFFRGSEDNPRTEIVVAEAIRLAKSLNMKTVAEGVEEKATVEFLANEGCDMIQGYYYAKPMPREEYEANIIPRPVTPAPAPVQVQQPAVAAEHVTQPVAET